MFEASLSWITLEMAENFSTALDNFIETYRNTALQNDALQIDYDSEWHSECVQNPPENGQVAQWRPILQGTVNTFAAMAEALELSIPIEFELLFTRYWSEHLDATAEQGDLTLLQVWNQDDFERLQQNLIGHVLMKRRLKQPETLFFAVTDQEDFIISLEHHSGHVVVEQVGKKPHIKLADSLLAFIQTLKPNPVHNAI